MDRGWKNFEVHERKRFEESASRNMGFKDNPGEISEESEEHGRENVCHLREWGSHHDQNVSKYGC